MAYEEYELSTQNGNPVELYQFTQGIVRWCYNSGTETIIYLGQTYLPSSVVRDTLKQSGDIFKDSLKITFNRENEFAAQYLGFAPENVTTVTIFRAHFEDASHEYITYWKGRISGARAQGNEIILECESVFTSIKRPGLRERYEYGCRRTLYRKGCNVNRELYKVTGTILSISNGIVISVGAAGSFPDGYFTGGMVVEESGISRFIVNHVGDSLTLSRPAATIVGNAIVDLYPGCDHLKETCNSKFSNIDNFGGFPWIPSVNLFSGVSVV